MLSKESELLSRLSSCLVSTILDEWDYVPSLIRKIVYLRPFAKELLYEFFFKRHWTAEEKQYFTIIFFPMLIEACNEAYFLELAVKFALSLETVYLPQICQACSVNKIRILPILNNFACIQSKWIQCHLEPTFDSEVSLPTSSYDSFYFAFIPLKNLSCMSDFIGLALEDSQSPFYNLNLERIAASEYSFNLDQLLRISNIRPLISKAIKNSRMSLHQICDWLISIVGTLSSSDLFNWIVSVADINFNESCRVLETSCHLSDIFWNDVADWLAENPNFIRNSSSRIISRIHDIKHLSPSFVLTASLLSRQTVRFSFDSLSVPCQRKSLDCYEQIDLLFSILSTISTTSKCSKLAGASFLLKSVDVNCKDLINISKFQITRLAYGSGYCDLVPLKSLMGTEDYSSFGCEESLKSLNYALRNYSNLNTDVIASHLATVAVFYEVPDIILTFSKIYEGKIRKLFNTHLASFGISMLYHVALKISDFSQLLQEASNLTNVCLNFQIENEQWLSIFDIFMFEAESHLEHIHSSFLFLDLSVLFLLRHLNSDIWKAHEAAIVKWIISVFTLECVKKSSRDLLRRLVIPILNDISNRIENINIQALCFTISEGHFRLGKIAEFNGTVNEAELSFIETLNPEVCLEYLCSRQFDESIFDSFSSKFPRILQKLYKAIKTPRKRLKICYWLMLCGFDISEVQSSDDESSTDRFERRIPHINSQYHRIKFAIEQIKIILSMIPDEHDNSNLHCYFYTLQSLCAFLGLSSCSNNDVWDAFTVTEKKQLQSFTTSKYKLDINFETFPAPLSANASSKNEYIWRLYCKLLQFYEHQNAELDFMKVFAANISVCNEQNLRIISSFCFSAMISIDRFMSFLIGEFTAAAHMAPLCVKEALLDIYDYIWQLLCQCLESSEESMASDLVKVRAFTTQLPAQTLCSLALDTQNMPRAIKYLEWQCKLSDEKSKLSWVLETLQRCYFSIDQAENGDGLSDFFNPRDLKQHSHLFLEDTLNTSTSLKIQLLTTQAHDVSPFDLSGLCKSLESSNDHEAILELLSCPQLKIAELGPVLRDFEIKSCANLSNWAFLESDYDNFTSISTTQPLDYENFIKWVKIFELEPSDEIDLQRLFKSPLLLKNALLLKQPFIKCLENTKNMSLLNEAELYRIKINILNESKLDEDVTRLQLIKNLRRRDLFHDALIEFIKLSQKCRDEHLVLQAKLMKELGHDVKAIEILEFSLYETPMVSYPVHKVHLKLAKYKLDSGHYPEKEIMKHYEVASKMSNDSRIYFQFAKFLDHDFDVISLQQDEAILKRAYLTLKNYSRALMSTKRHDVEVMPRFLTIWLDMTANNKISVVWVDKANSVASKATKSIQTSQFFRSLPQLVSRLMHQNKVTVEILYWVLSRMFTTLPHSVIWATIAVVKSSLPGRQKRAIDLYLKLRKDPTHGNLCKDYSQFADLLINLANYKTMEGTKVLSLSKDFPALKKCLPSCIQVPAKLHLNDSNIVTIESALDRVDIVMSMQKPKKLTFIGSDGTIYPFLCKPNDDLRKDYRMIELFDLVNSLFKKETGQLRSKMNIARFTVTPLNEEAGLVEWVPNTCSFRSIILNYYKREGVNVSLRDIRLNQKTDTELVSYFENEVLPRFPIVFDKWLLERFPLAPQWLEARNIFAISSACISMLGYIVGLGDRHGENILIDESNGTCVHVDFNCLFEKGKTFEVPELVPFRLTRNMVAGMGLPEWRGYFLKCSEMSLQIFRKNSDLLQTNMESFVYDPMVEWLKSKKSDNEVVNEQGLGIMKNVLVKISGRNDNKFFATPRGQALDLIAEATNLANLAKMYIGWSAFI